MFRFICLSHNRTSFLIHEYWSWCPDFLQKCLFARIFRYNLMITGSKAILEWSLWCLFHFCPLYETADTKRERLQSLHSSSSRTRKWRYISAPYGPYVKGYSERIHLFTKKQYDCRNIIFANSSNILACRTLCVIIYNVRLSVSVELYERRVVLYKRLWKLLIDKDMTKTELRKQTETASSTLSKRNRNEYVPLEVLVRVCCALHCE